MPNYANGKIYCIRNRADGDKIVYVGSTTRPLSERMAEHRKHARTQPEKMKILTLLQEKGIDNFRIELINDFPCQRKEQLAAEEGRHIRLYGIDALTNTYIAGRSKQAYANEHIEERKEQMKQWNETHKEERKTYMKIYATENAAEIKEKRNQYNVKNKEVIREKRKAYRNEHIEERKEKMKQWNETHKEGKKEYNKIYSKNYYIQNRERLLGKQKEEYARKKNPDPVAEAPAA